MFFRGFHSAPLPRFRAGTACLAFLFLAASFAFFFAAYIYPPAHSAPEVPVLPPDFYFTFYTFFAAASGATILFIFSENAVSSLLLAFIAISSMSLVDYSIADWLTIRVWMFAAFVAAVAARFSWPWNLPSSFVLALCFTATQDTSFFLGENILAVRNVTIGESARASFAIVLVTVSLCISTIRLTCERIEKANERIRLLEGTITKLSEFNQSLQAFARTADEVATKKERYRISREIHDISGYIFTNIIALMDAIISTGCQNREKAGEICLTTRVQAQEGLQETRRALRAFRTLDSNRERGLRAIYKIKNIFEDTTGVEVKIESGNLPLTFGDDIDLVLYRTVQEALTNALRHGHATKVAIDFRMADSSLFMTVLDNGSGTKNITRGIGLAGMEERISELGGAVEANNAAEGGFRLAVRIPLSEGLEPTKFRGIEPTKFRGEKQ